MTQTEIRAALDRVLADPLFQEANQISAFLRFVVEISLAGRSRELKEYVIGVEVLKRGANYSPREDPGARILAGRVRSRLAEYYQGSGKDDWIVIHLPKGGYVPAFESREAEPIKEGAAQGEAGEVRAATHTWWVAVVNSGLVALFVILAAAWWVSRKVPYQPTAPVPLTSYPGEEVQPHLSPDGKRVAFSWNRGNPNNFDIYVKDLDRDDPVRLTSDPARDFSPAWSPDGRTIAFGRLLTPKTAAVYVIPSSGGAERKLAETTAIGVFHASPFVAWSPDGKWLAYSAVDYGADGASSPIGSLPISLFLISVGTGATRRLTTRPGGAVGDSGPAFAPDGHALAFIRTQTLAISNLYVQRLGRGLEPSGEPNRLTSWQAVTSSPSWSPNAKSIVVASGSWGRTHLWRIAESGKTPPIRIESLSWQAEDPTVSQKGQLAFASKSTDVNIWRLSLARAGIKGGEPSRFISSTVVDGNPQFSPDGKRIVFASDRSGARQLWLCNADGSNPVQLTSMDAPMSGGPRWSPDGTKILFDSNPTGRFQVYMISASGGPARPVTTYAADQAYGVWSPDSRWIYFMSSRAGRRHVWKQPSEGGEAVQVTRSEGEGVVPFPSADGKYLYYSERAGQGEGNGLGGLRRLRLADGVDERVLPSVTFWNAALVPEGIYFIPRADSDGHFAIHFFDFRKRKDTVVQALSGKVSEGLTVSPDGGYLLFTEVDEERSDLMLVRDFR